MGNSGGYFSVTLNVRCRKRLEELERLTLRSKANIVEVLILKAIASELGPLVGVRDDGEDADADGRGQEEE